MILPLCEYQGYPIRVFNNDDTQGFFFSSFFSILWGRWTGDHLLQEFSKFGYRLDRKSMIIYPKKNLAKY
jgi:hypothetical protein